MNRGGACGGFRYFSGAMAAVVMLGLEIVFQLGLETDGRIWFQMAVNLGPTLNVGARIKVMTVKSTAMPRTIRNEDKRARMNKAGGL